MAFLPPYNLEEIVEGLRNWNVVINSNLQIISDALEGGVYKISDEDNDTWITTQLNPDEDLIRGAVAAAEVLVIGPAAIDLDLATLRLNFNYTGSTYTNQDATIQVADDAIIFWDEGDDRFELSKPLQVAGTIQGATSLWYRTFPFDAINLAIIGSGAEQITPTADTLGGFNLDEDAEYLYLNQEILSDWNGISDLLIDVFFEVDVNNGAGDPADVAKIDAECFYKGVGDTVNKTQTPTDTVTVGASARYKGFLATLVIDHDKVDHVVDVGDRMAIRINFDATGSDIGDIVVNQITVKYKTLKMNVEV